MVKQRRERVENASLIISLFFYSTNSIDFTTYPKILSLIVVLSILFLSRLRIDSTLYFQGKAIMLFYALFLVYLVAYGFENASNILFGYPERNLGLLSLMIFILSYLYAQQRSDIQNFNLIFYASTLISITFWIESLVKTEKVLVQQFTYPEPNAINQNITSLFLTLGFVSGLLKIVETRNYMKFRSLLYQLFSLMMILLALIGIGDKQTLICLLIIVYATFLYNVKLSIRALQYLHGFILIICNVIFWFIVSSTPINKSILLDDSSILERINIARIGFAHVITNPVHFRLPDTTADLNLVVLGSTNNRQYIDNMHNVWLEVGSHYGWIPAVASLLILSWLNLKVFKKLITSQTHFQRPRNCLIFALFNVIYFSLYWTILHPITIFALGIVVSLIQSVTNKSILKTSKEIFEKREKKSHKVNMWNSVHRPRKNKFAMYTISSFIFFCLFTLNIFISIDFQKKVNFKKTEVKLMNGEIQFDRGVEKLHQYSLELKDRNYLDYSGRQLAQLRDCYRLNQNLDMQQQLSYGDQRVRNLKEWYRMNC